MESLGESAYNHWMKHFQYGGMDLCQGWDRLDARAQRAWQSTATQILGKFHSDLISELGLVPEECRRRLVSIVDAIACRSYSSNPVDSVVNTPETPPESLMHVEKLHDDHGTTLDGEYPRWPQQTHRCRFRKPTRHPRI